MSAWSEVHVHASSVDGPQWLLLDGTGECNPPLAVSGLCIIQAVVHVCATKLASTFLILSLLCFTDVFLAWLCQVRVHNYRSS